MPVPPHTHTHTLCTTGPLLLKEHHSTQYYSASDATPHLAFTLMLTEAMSGYKGTLCLDLMVPSCFDFAAVL